MKRIGLSLFVLLTLAVAAHGAPPQKPEPQKTPNAMRVVIVRSADFNCAEGCAEWISAQGQITKQTPGEFRRVFKLAGEKKLPILIDSGGGSVEAALEIGRMIRARKLDIAVTRTSFTSCAPTDDACERSESFKGFRGVAGYNPATCASACPLLLAGGVRRLSPVWSRIGVHQFTRLSGGAQTLRRYRIYTRMINGRRVEVRRELISEQIIKRPDVTGPASETAYRKVEAYFREMGLSNALMPLIRATPPEKMRFLDRNELFLMDLVTEVQGGDILLASTRKPIATASASPTAPRPATGPNSIANIVLRLGRYDDRFVGVDLAFSYSRRGQMIDMLAMPIANGVALVLSPMTAYLQIPNGGTFAALPETGDQPGASSRLKVAIPLADFCKLDSAHGFSLSLELPARGAQPSATLSLDTRPIDWMGSLLRDACRR